MGGVEVEFKDDGGDEEKAEPPVFVLASEGGEEKGEEKYVRNHQSKNTSDICPCARILGNTLIQGARQWRNKIRN